LAQASSSLAALRATVSNSLTRVVRESTLACRSAAAMPTKAAANTKPQQPQQRAQPPSQQQQQIDSALRAVEADLRELGRCLQQAKAVAGTERAGAVLQRLAKLDANMQQHRARIRAWATQKSIPPAVQTKLAAARTKIEGEARKIKDAQRALEVDKPASEHSAEDGCSENHSATPALPAPKPHDDVTEVKIVAEQLVRNAEESDLESEFICKICLVHVVGCKPKLTRCSHLFCGDCLMQWFAAQPSNQTWAGRAQSAGVPCPVCKEPLNADADLHLVARGGSGGSAMLWHMLSSTKVVCSNNPRCSPGGRCDWVGDYESFQRHIRCCTNEPTPMEPVLDSQPLAICEAEAEAEAEEPMPVVVEEAQPKILRSASDSDDGTTCPGPGGRRESSEDLDTSVVAESSSGEEADASPVAAPVEEAAPTLESLIRQLVELKAANPDLIAKEPEAPATFPSVAAAAFAPEVNVPSPRAQPHECLGGFLASPPGVSLAAPPSAMPPSTQPKPRTSPKSKSAQKPGAMSVAAVAAAQQAQAAQAAQWQAAWAAQAASIQSARMAYARQMAHWQMAGAAQMQAAWSAAAAQGQLGRPFSAGGYGGL